MKKFLLKYTLLTVLFITLSIYSFNSLKYIVGWYLSSSTLGEEINVLEAQEKDVDKQIKVYSKKVYGLREETLDKEVLETQAKSILNMINEDEIIIVD